MQFNSNNEIGEIKELILLTVDESNAIEMEPKIEHEMCVSMHFQSTIGLNIL